jgi:trk system potassium uptake protein TrkH
MKHLTPNRLIFLSFAAAIAVGTIVLRWQGGLPNAPVAWIDALFTATSATCVTGLTVKDTGTEFSLAGQWIILGCIQVGGLGILTLSSWFLFLFGRRPTLSERTALTDAFGLPIHLTVSRLLRRILLYTFAIEALGTSILFVRFLADYPPGRALHAAVFHAVSAFCNAGFSLFRKNLVNYANDPCVNLVIMGLIVLGGLGFYVLEETRAGLVARWRGRRWRWTLHTRVVLTTTAALIVGGAAAIYAIESLNRVVTAPWHARIFPAFFQSVTARTAGYNTVDMTLLSNGTALVLIVLMFIGASPGSTGGGIKTTTFATLVALLAARWRGRSDAELFGRRVPGDLVAKALGVTVGFLIGYVICIMALQLTELGGKPPQAVRGAFLDLTFETVSAFGTVGLSLGITPFLTTAGKLAIVLAMFTGRVGPLAFALTLVGERQGLSYRYPEERVLIG